MASSSIGRRLRVTAGHSLDSMVPISVNTSKAHTISSDIFEGELVAHIKGFIDEEGNEIHSEYFDREDRVGITWSIQVQGRFRVPYNADDILFGNTFDRPLKLPWGTAAVLRFMNYMDPTLEHDLQSQSKPWALSPLVATMPHFAHRRVPDVPTNDQAFPSKRSLIDDTSELYLAAVDDSIQTAEEFSSGTSSPIHGHNVDSALLSSSWPASARSDLVEAPTSAPLRTVDSSTGELDASLVQAHANLPQRQVSTKNEMRFESSAQRRSYFSSPEKRAKITFGPLDVITTDFCYGFINFAPSLSLQLPGGLSFDLTKYWDGQPVRFVCCERRQPNSDIPWGRTFWCVSIELIDEEDGREANEEDGISSAEPDDID